jgi:hypothetical protein
VIDDNTVREHRQRFYVIGDNGAGGALLAVCNQSSVRAYLAEQSEPCSAAEIAAALSEAHPDRVIKTTVVRTTPEGLVARSSAQRLKQGHSVFYRTLEKDQESKEGIDAEDDGSRAGRS